MDSKTECNNINLHCFSFLDIEIQRFSIFVSGPNLRQIQIFEFSWSPSHCDSFEPSPNRIRWALRELRRLLSFRGFGAGTLSFRPQNGRQRWQFTLLWLGASFLSKTCAPGSFLIVSKRSDKDLPSKSHLQYARTQILLLPWRTCSNPQTAVMYRFRQTFFYSRGNRWPIPGNLVSGLSIMYIQRTRPSKLEMAKFRKNRNFEAVPPELRCSHGASSSFPAFVFTRTITYPKRVEIRPLLQHLWLIQISASSKFSNFSNFAPKKVPRGILAWLPGCAFTRPIQCNKPIGNRLRIARVILWQRLLGSLWSL